MYQGGMIVCADDADYSSYSRLGLRCLECGEEVYLKSGSEKKPHFAHFQATYYSKCPLRVTGYSEGSSGLTPEDKKQRRELFQNYFLSMIASSDDNFYQKIQVVKEKINTQKLNNFTEACCNHFSDNSSQLVTECRIFSSKTYDQNLLLQILIACEAIDYLSLSSSRILLEQLVHYSLDKFCITITDNWDNYVTQIKPNEIIQQIKDILINVSWLSILSELQEIQRSRRIYGFG
ncbi:hypothetical protein C7B69_04420 [filamentous cyanobacterium Phorm 46]|nr:hypothetical protein C7B69_04420 [filamentous cyanobacterium Phorm 46]